MKEASKSQERKFSYTEVDYNNMRIFDKECYATYAGEGELVILLKEIEPL